jgi:glycosyltransferase involved in cell wall biosynthesis
MRILFVRPGPFPPELYAGTELTLHWLCRKLVAEGHDVVFAAQSKLMDGKPAAVDHACGYPVSRAKSIVMATKLAVAHFHADVVVIIESGSWVSHLLPITGDLPLVVYEHQLSIDASEAPDELKSRAVYIANSDPTAAHLRATAGIEAKIVRPLFGIGRYAHIQPHGNRVLFVSLQRRKGSDVAIRIAQSRPHVPFVFVESWTKTPERTEYLRGYVRAIPNITLLPNRPGLDDVLPGIKLLLMPSRSQEAWGRTATEAQTCGIPVLGSSRGNLPVTIGPGGITLDPDEPIERWLAAFDRIMGDAAFYADLSRKAREHGRAKIHDAQRAYEVFESALNEALAGRRA